MFCYLNTISGPGVDEGAQMIFNLHYEYDLWSSVIGETLDQNFKQYLMILVIINEYNAVQFQVMNGSKLFDITTIIGVVHL